MKYFCKRLLCLLLALSICIALAGQQYAGTPARQTAEWFRCGLSYQIQPRAFTPEGTLSAAEAKFDHLLELGVNTIYLWPVFVADDDTTMANWSPRQIKSGFNNPRNPYRLKDYYHIDPEYGGDQALRHFVQTAHSKGLHVLLDLVFCHCGPTAVFVKDHPEFFQYDSEGRMKVTRWNFPMLNFQSKELRLYLKTNMLYWMCDYGVDGFRCDVADDVPLDFWCEVRAEMEAFNPESVLVAEGERADDTHYAFDANYNWPVCQRAITKILRDPLKYRKDKGGAAYIRECYEKYAAKIPDGALNWNMTENHDWASDAYHNRAEKKYGHKNRELGLALCFALDGVPLLYNGQEICDTCRHSIFSTPGACCIDWTQKESIQATHRMQAIQEWMKLRNEYSCMHHGKTIWLDNDNAERICSLRRSDGSGRDVLFIGNFSEDKARVNIEGQSLILEPWEYIFCPESEFSKTVKQRKHIKK